MEELLKKVKIKMIDVYSFLKYFIISLKEMKVKIAKIKNIVYEKDNYINTNYTGLAKLIYYFNHKLLEFGFSKKSIINI